MNALVVAVGVILAIVLWLGLAKLVFGYVKYFRLMSRRKYRWNRTEVPDLNEFAQGAQPGRPARGEEGNTGGHR